MQGQHQQQQQQQPSSTGAVSRAITRLPDDNADFGRDVNKNAMTKTYHTLKDLISSKFKKEQAESMDELNNVVVQQQQQHTQLSSVNGGQFQNMQNKDTDEYRLSHTALPTHMRQMQGLNQSQPNIWNGKHVDQAHPMSVARTPNPGQSMAARAASQPQLNAPFDGQNGQLSVAEQRNSLANIADGMVTDSDDGGFASRAAVRRPQIYHIQQQQQQQQQHQATSQLAPPPTIPPPGQRNSPQTFSATTNQSMSYGQQQQYASPYQHSHIINHQSKQMVCIMANKSTLYSSFLYD